MATTNDEGYGQLYMVIKDFHARLGDELTITSGDIVELISDDREYGDGWYMGKNLNTNSAGLYPKVFTRVKENQPTGQRPALLRSRSRRLTPQGRTVSQSTTASLQLKDVPETPQLQMPPLSSGSFEVNDNVNSSKTSADTNNNSFQVRAANSGLDGTGLPGANEKSAASVANTSITSQSSGRRDPVSVYSSVHRALNDIDRALEELRIDNNPANNAANADVTAAIGAAAASAAEAMDNSKSMDSGANLDPAEVETWTGEQVTQWFSLLGFDIQSAGQFARHKISGAILIQMELAYLKELDIASFGTRFEMYKEIEELRLTANKIRKDHPPSQTQLSSYGTPNSRSHNPYHHARKRSQSMDDVQALVNQRSATSATPSTSKQPQTTSPSRVNNNALSQRPLSMMIQSPFAQKPALGSEFISSNPGSGSGSLSSAIEEEKESGHGAATGKDSGPQGHRRTSSEASTTVPVKATDPTKTHRRYSSLASIQREPSPVKNKSIKSEHRLSRTNLSPERRAVSAKEISSHKKDSGKRILSATAAFRSLTSYRPSKAQTSAFQEGIRDITPGQAAKHADFSGWMFKRGNLSIGSWKQRFFVLNKTRLSYFGSAKDTKEKGLIDITSHRVVTATETEDKLTTVYAATAGFGRYCFKIVPPAPGSRKGLTFTQQKVHYFVVETLEEMRGWMAALMKATIELDESVPVISSCVTPTIPLQKAQELLQEARVNARANMESIQRMKEKEREKEREMSGIEESTSTDATVAADFHDSASGDTTQATQATQLSQGSSQMGSPQATTPSTASAPRLDGSRHSLPGKPLSPVSPGNGMSTPYLITSGLILPNSASTSEIRRPSNPNTNPTPIITRLDEPEQAREDSSSTRSSTPLMSAMGAMGRRVLSMRRNKQDN
ncbi:hypothetical protein FOA43_000712 [Brettanomyces nanus]|uniref:Protein BOI2 n=1 Tax=Eeniella nana TaxID=13502 RepID=A0A875RZU3_EENNA|nr:uncharacterized protein FOA43_000712 [Brettanomyces nanus]QPG73402.1 hypothetical protein FOA43_000712 [Brettanomyces nanus]